MAGQFQDKSLKIIGVDGSGAVRQLLNDVMKKEGFTNFQAMSSVKDVLQSLEVEIADWIILPLMADQEVNAMQVLKLISGNPELKSIRVSFLLEDDETFCLPDAFALGLLSWFPKPFNKDSLSEEVSKFYTKFEEENWSATRLSASYAYNYFSEADLHESSTALLKGILNLFPGDVDALINLAKPLNALEKKSEAQNSLRQARLIDEERKEEIDGIATELFGEEGLGAPAEGAEPDDILSLGTCIIVDSDETASAEIKEILQGIGVKEVVEFQDGESAWIWLQENEAPSVVFMEWRIPELTGPYLVQRIRKKYPCLSLIVVSALIEEDDAPLIQEMGVASIIKKPLDKTAFIQNLIYTVRQERVPSDVEFLERKIRQNLADKNLDEAMPLIEKYRVDNNIPELRKTKIEAELAYYQQDYEKARNLAVESLRQSDDSVQILNLLGKTLMQLHDYSSALRCFEKAQLMSPKNVQRLCSIAEVNAELDKEKESDEALEAAESADGGNEEIEQTTAKIAISTGDIKKASDIMKDMESLSELISYMNNKAVTLARCEKYEEGIELYKKTINSIPDKHQETKAIVSYNLALAYVRLGEQGEAAETLEKVIDLGQTRVLAKSNSLKTRLEKAMEGGKKVELSEGKSEKEKSEKEKPAEEIGAPQGDSQESESTDSTAQNQLAASVAEIQPGDLCCFRVFDNPQAMDEKTLKLVAKLPRFNPREAIERSETGGADRVNATG